MIEQCRRSYKNDIKNAKGSFFTSFLYTDTKNGRQRQMLRIVFGKRNMRTTSCGLNRCFAETFRNVKRVRNLDIHSFDMRPCETGKVKEQQSPI